MQANKQQGRFPLGALGISKKQTTPWHYILKAAHTLVPLLLLSLLCSLLLEEACRASDIEDRERELAPLFEEPCRRFGLPPALLKAIMRQESWGEQRLVNVEGKDIHPKTDAEALSIAEKALSQGRSFDVGLMQINSCHIKEYHIPLRILFRPKDNIFMACFLLSELARRDGLTWKAVGRYHSFTPWRRDDYARKIKRHLRDILAQRPA